MNNSYETKPRNAKSEAVKTFAIIFLAVMLVLTFFSNTIMNWSLPQVNGSYSSYGAIATSVRGSGTVQSNMEYNVTVDSTHKVQQVLVGKGSYVNKGDTMIIFEAGDSDELAQAKDTLAEYQDQLSALTDKNFDYSDDELAIADAEQALSDLKFDRELEGEGFTMTVNEAKLAVKKAQAEYDDCVAEVEKIEKEIEAEISGDDNMRIQSKRKLLKEAQDNLTRIEAEVEEAQAKLDAMYDANRDLMPGITTAMVNAQSQTVIQLRSSVKYYENQVTSAQAALDSAISELSGILNDQLEDATLFRDEAKAELDKQKSNLELAQTLANLDSQIKTSERSLAQLKSALEDKKANDLSTSASDKRKIETLNTKISVLKEKIAKLESGEKNVVTANYSGTVTSVNVIAGDTVSSGTSVAVIEVADKGYTVSFSVSNEQAARLSPGDTATVSGTYWGSSAEATLISAKSESGGKTKLLTFEVTGDVTPGQSVTISVGEKSSYYDSVIPKNALHEDSNGKFVLVAKSKSSPLGTRYVATRVAVTVLNQDEKNVAIATDESYFYEFVITSSTAPVSEGDYVRLSEK